MSSPTTGGSITPAGEGDAALAALLEQSRAGAEVVEQGGFRLDWSRALDKIKRFQLTDPHRYVLELVQAAVAAGSEAIEITTDADDVIMHFGAVLSRAELERLFDYLFSRDPALAHNRQLALGVNAALALRPKFIVVDSGDGQRGVRLELRSHTDLSLVETSAPQAVAGTRIHVRERRSWKVLVDAVRRSNAEDRLLVQHCRFAPLPLRLNGVDLRRPLDLSHLVRQPVAGRDVRGEVLLPLIPRDASEIHFCSNGVEVATERVDNWKWLGPVGVIGHVDSPAFDRNASHTAIQHDAAHERALRAVRRAIVEALTRLLRQALIEDPGLRQRIPPLRGYLQKAAQALLRGRRQAKLSAELEALLDVEDLVDLPFEDRRSGPLRPLWDAFQRDGQVRVAGSRFALRCGEGDVPEALRQVALGPLPLLRAVFHGKLERVDPQLRLLEQGLANRRRREALRQEAVLPPAGLLVRVPLSNEQPPMVGELGLSLRPEIAPGRSQKNRPGGVLVTFLRHGIPLGDLKIPDRWLRGRAVVDSPDFEPTLAWDGVARNPACKAIGKVLGRSVLDLLAALHQAFPAPPPPAKLLELARWDPAADGDQPLEGWDRAGWADPDPLSAAARMHLEALLLKAPRVPRESAPWLYEWPIFFTLDGKARSLNQLEQLAGMGKGVLHYAIGVPWGPGGDEVLCITAQQRSILRSYLSATTTRKARKAVEHARRDLAEKAQVQRRRLQNLRRAELRRQAPRLAVGRYLVLRDLPAELGEGQVGIPSDPGAASRVLLLVDGLPLCEVELSCPVPLQAVVQSPAIEADEEFALVSPGPAFEDLRRRIVGECGNLVADLAVTPAGRAPYGRALIWSYLEWHCQDLRRSRSSRRGGRNRREPADLPAGLLEVPIVPTVAHGLLSLRQLREEAEAHDGQLRWIGVQASEQRSERPIAISDSRALLGQLLGLSVVDYGRQLRAEQALLERMRQPRRAARLDVATAIRVPVQGPEIEGELGIAATEWAGQRPTGRGNARIQVLADGRPLQVRPVNLEDLPLVGVISSPRFVPNDRFDAVVDDDAWEDGRRALRIAADRLVAMGCARPHRRSIRLTLQVMAGRRFHGRPRLDLVGAPEIDWTLARAPLWLSPAGEPLTLEAIAAAWQDRGRVLVVDADERGHPAPGRVIVAAEPSTCTALEEIFGVDGVEDGTAVLRRDEQAYLRREQAPTVLSGFPADATVAPARIHGMIDGVAIAGEIGLLRDGVAGSGRTVEVAAGLVVRVGIQGRLLCEHVIDHPLSALAVVECAGLAVDEEWTRLADERQGAALEALVEDGLWRSVDRIARRAGRLDERNLDDRARRRLLLDALSALLERPDPPPLLERLAVAPLFRTVRGEAVTAKALLLEQQRSGRVLVVADSASAGVPEDGRLIVHADEAALRTMEVLLNEGLLRHDAAWAAELQGQQRRRVLQRVVPALQLATVAEVRFEAGSTTGLAGLLRPATSGSPDPGADPVSIVRLHIDHRPVAIENPRWHPAIEVWVNDDRLEAGPAFDRVLHDAVHAEVLRVVQEQIPELVARAAEIWQERWSDRQDDPLRCRLCHHVAAQQRELVAAANARGAGPEARLLDAPLWSVHSTAAGQGQLVSSREVLAAVAAGTLAVITRAALDSGGVLAKSHAAALEWATEGAAGEPDPRLLLAPNELEAEALAILCGGELPEDLTDELVRQAAQQEFLAREPVPVVDLAAAGCEAASVLCRRRLHNEQPPWTGELGLLTPGRSLQPSPRKIEVALFFQRRPLTRVVVDSVVAAVAAVDVDGFTLRDDLSGVVEEQALAELCAELETTAIDLLDELARERFGAGRAAAEQDLERDAELRRLLLQTVARLQQLRARGGRGSAAEGALRILINGLPLLQELSGERRSLAALRQRQELFFVSPDLASRARQLGIVGRTIDERLERALVVARDDGPLLAMLGRASSLDGVLVERIEAEERRQRAPTAVHIDWGSTTVRSEPAERQGLTSLLALRVPLGAGELALMSRGRLVERVAPPERLAGLIGWIDGALETDSSFTRVRLSRPQRETIEELYQERLAAAVERAAQLSAAAGSGRARADAEYRALCDYVAHYLFHALRRDGLQEQRRMVLDTEHSGEGLDPTTRLALSVRLAQLHSGRWATLSELVDDDVIAIVICPDRVRADGPDEAGTVLVRSGPGGPLMRLLESLMGRAAVVSHERWARRGARRREKKQQRSAGDRKRSEQRLVSALQGLLRELISAARLERVRVSWLDLQHVAQIKVTRGRKLKIRPARRLLVRPGQGPLLINAACPVWELAVGQLCEDGSAGRRSAIALQVAAATVAELRGLGLATDEEVVQLMTLLVALSARTT